jgi:hypothetical protein
MPKWTFLLTALSVSRKNPLEAVGLYGVSFNIRFGGMTEPDYTAVRRIYDFIEA